jgi:NADPH-dependent 2,4-dienoyl-CoA reductase/sulfur reductase-like enzyme
VGASLAGHATARALRASGFAGPVTLVGEEPERPYDRPPLSKAFLAGRLEAADLALEASGEDLVAEWLLGVPAQALDVATRTVTLADGRRLSADAVVLATGSRARRLPQNSGSAPLAGVHVVRTLADARALREELVPGVRVVVVGAGFIGAEVASTAQSMGLAVTVVEAAPAPLAGPLGVELGLAVAALHERHGVHLECGVPVARLTGEGRVSGVELVDGTVLPADVVVVGIGSVPAVDWLVGSGLDVSAGVVCSSTGAAAPGVWAVGDCSAWYDPVRGHAQRLEHWTDALERPVAMVKAMLGQPAGTLRAPYFWSEQYGVMIQFAGRHLGGEQVRIEAGSAATGDILATYRRPGAQGQDEVVAVLGMDQPRLFTRARRGLAATPVDPAVLPALTPAVPQPVA